MQDKEQKHLEEEINLLDYLIVFVKQKRMIFKITLSMAVLTAIISLLMSPQYRAVTKIFSSEQDGAGIAMQLMAQFSGITGISPSSAGLQEPNKLFVEMLESRTILDTLIDKFDLMKVYDKKYRVDTRKVLSKHLNISDDVKSGVITIAVDDEDPQRAADMANAMVDELNGLVSKLAVTEAAERRLFFEEQLKEAKMSLINAEEAMRKFQEKTGGVRIESQAESTIDGMANFRAKIAEKEVQLQVMRTYSTPSNPDLQKVNEALKGLRKELRKLETGDSNDSLITTELLPEVGTEYLRRLRDLKFNETLFELLVKQYETARLEEASDAMMIQVVDRAVPPEKKATPDRAKMVVIALFVGFLVSVMAAFFKEFAEKISANPENMEKMDMLRQYAHLQSSREVS